MRAYGIRTQSLCIAALLILVMAGGVDAQVSRPLQPRPTVKRKSTPNFTQVSVELMVGTEGVGLRAQQWQQVFAKMNFPVRIRRGILGEKIEIKERTYGTIREVTVIGQLDRSGRIILPTRTFTRSDAGKLQEFLRELKTYGAQGAPNGKPLWGLNKKQFGGIYSALSRALAVQVQDSTLERAVTKMSLPTEYPVWFSTAAREHLEFEFPQTPKVRPPLKGLAKGAALAILLNQYGLGFRPLRSPKGSLELAIEPLSETVVLWPIGWEPKLSLPKTAPKLFELIPVELDDVKLVDVLDAISAKTKVPIFIDYYGTKKDGINVKALRVSHPPKKTSWSLALRGVTTRYRLTRKLQIDERGRPFIWIKTAKPVRAKK